MLPGLHSSFNTLFPHLLALIDAGREGLIELERYLQQSDAKDRVSTDQVQLLAPIAHPRQNIICLGWNYHDHIRETSTTTVNAATENTNLPQYPIVFTKAASCVTGPYTDIPYDPEISTRMDWEVELGVVVGKAGHKIAVAEALDYVFGYTIINDITGRELQKRHQQFYLGKSLPHSCPMGPYIVTADDIPDPQQLQLCCRVNGVVKQQASTAQQIFDVATVLATLSKLPALACGDVIATGTPSGVGYARKPPEYLTPGDVVECEIESIGCIKNTIVTAPQL